MTMQLSSFKNLSHKSPPVQYSISRYNASRFYQVKCNSSAKTNRMIFGIETWKVWYTRTMPGCRSLLRIFFSIRISLPIFECLILRRLICSVWYLDIRNRFPYKNISITFAFVITFIANTSFVIRCVHFFTSEKLPLPIWSLLQNNPYILVTLDGYTTWKGITWKIGSC